MLHLQTNFLTAIDNHLSNFEGVPGILVLVLLSPGPAPDVMEQYSALPASTGQHVLVPVQARDLGEEEAGEAGDSGGDPGRDSGIDSGGEPGEPGEPGGQGEVDCQDRADTSDLQLGTERRSPADQTCTPGAGNRRGRGLGQSGRGARGTGQRSLG